MTVTQKEQEQIKKCENWLPQHTVSQCKEFAESEDDYADMIFDAARVRTMALSAEDDPDSKYY